MPDSIMIAKKATGREGKSERAETGERVGVFRSFALRSCLSGHLWFCNIIQRNTLKGPCKVYTREKRKLVNNLVSNTVYIKHIIPVIHIDYSKSSI